MNTKARFILKLVLSLALAALAALFISYNFVSFALVFLIAGWAFCPVRTFHPERKS